MNMPAANIGHNSSVASDIPDRLASDYAALLQSAETTLEEARALPPEVTDELDLRRYSDMIVRIRDTGKRADAARKAEKEPYLRAGQQVDGFFTTLVEKLDKATKALSARATEYQRRKEAEERARRQREADEARRVAEEARHRAAEELRVAEEARLAAERARKPEIAEQKSAVAAQAETIADNSKVNSYLAEAAANQAAVEAARKPAELARSRFEEGRVATLKEVGYVEITDKGALDKEALWPFLKEDDVLKALRAWAKTTSFKKPMDGAVVEMRKEGSFR